MKPILIKTAALAILLIMLATSYSCRSRKSCGTKFNWNTGK
ncbi:MAG TPA: hypothetical protein VF411_11645 [Bacteroidia bacterium]